MRCAELSLSYNKTLTRGLPERTCDPSHGIPRYALRPVRLPVCCLCGNYNSSMKSSSFHTGSSVTGCSLSLYAATERRQNYSDGTRPPGTSKTTNTNASADTSNQRSHGCASWCLSSDAAADVEVTCRLIL